MNGWKVFEEAAFRYLTQNYTSKNTFYRKIGGGDSTLSDIEVIKDHETLFFIESKMSGVQCGQFVLLDKSGKFEYSSRNKSAINYYSQCIMEYMNENYEIFQSVSTKSIPIKICTDILANWIIEYYKSKNVKYIITGYDMNNFIIFPLHKFDEYFNISANYRKKKSGSRSLSRKYMPHVQSLINNLYNARTIIYDKGKAYIEILETLPNTIKLESDVYDYYLVKKYNNVYEIRMLSNTSNANVIFSCILKNEQDINDLNLFKSDVK